MHSIKVFSPIDFTLLGILTLVIHVQHSNALSLICVVPSGITMSVVKTPFMYKLSINPIGFEPG